MNASFNSNNDSHNANSINLAEMEKFLKSLNINDNAKDKNYIIPSIILIAKNMMRKFPI